VVKVTATVTVLVAVVDGGAAPTAWRPFSESNTQNLYFILTNGYTVGND
jgi:hypothetical protein